VTYSIIATIGMQTYQYAEKLTVVAEDASNYS